MTIILIIIAFIALNWVIAYSMPRLLLCLTANYLLILVLRYFSITNDSATAILLLIMFVITALFYLRPIRQRLFSERLMQWLITRLPAISKTEKEALEAGDSWMEASLFRGKPDWRWLKKLELSRLNEEEQRFFDNEVNQLCELIDDWKVVNEDHDLSESAWQFIKDKGFCGLTMEKKYGGKEFSAAAVSAIVEKVAAHSFTAGVTVMVPNSLGLGELFSHFGTKEQKQKFLPDLASGKHLACFALTGPETGSDASNIPDVGIVCHQQFNGEKTLGVKINFNKRYITLAPVATLVGLAFNLRDPDQLLKDKGSEGITCCYIPREHPGLTIGQRHYPCGMPIMNGPIQGKDVFVPLEWIVGGQKMAGKGWSILMSALSTGRAVSLPAISQGISTAQYLSSSAYASVRRQFGESVGDFEGVQQKLAQIAGLTYIAEACRTFTCTALDYKVKPAVASAIAKYHSTEIGRIIINHALDIHAGRGVMDGPSNYLTGHYRGLLISITGEGSNVMMRNLVIFGQALTRCHPYIPALMQAATAKQKRAFDKVLWRSVGHTIGNIARLTWLMMSNGVFLSGLPKGALQKHARGIAFLSAAFAVASDLSVLVLGGKLKQKERISACLADMLSYLYLGTAVIKYYQIRKTDKEELLHAQWALDYCLFQCQEAYFELIQNFPNRFVALFLKLRAFPFGRKFKKPSHSLENKLAQSMQRPTALRQHFKSQLHLECNSINTVEQAFLEQQKIIPIRKKLDVAIKTKIIDRKAAIEQQLQQAVAQQVITDDESQAFLIYHKQYWRAIMVDAFTSI